jgi:hypothetical protein
MKNLLLQAGAWYEATNNVSTMYDNGMGSATKDSANSDTTLLFWIIILILGALITTASTSDSGKGVNRFLSFCCGYVLVFFIWYISTEFKF